MTPTRAELRERLEAIAETVVALLDEIDGDPDLEPDADAEPDGDEADASFPEGGRGAVAMGYDLHEDSEEDDHGEDDDPAEDADPREDDDPDSCVCDGPHDGEEGI